ncbi:MAG: hypothetical protein BRC44_15105 [Cyanobacteria bacterium QS_4_48_99]|nr:MAG: hypothetical protein BRC44_15105 [Cyanobacteria bacterium QS_4_48_99]
MATAISAVAPSASLAAWDSGQSAQNSAGSSSPGASDGQNSQNTAATKQQDGGDQGKFSLQESVTLTGAGASFPAPL